MDTCEVKNDYYVYAWLRPCGEVFYVGKGRGNRDRVQKYNNPIFQRIVAKIKKSGSEPSIIRLHEGLTEADAHRLEVSEISRHGRINMGTGTLANLTDGGEGSSGWAPSEDTRAKIGAAHKGKKLSPDHRAKIMARVTNPSEWTRAKMSASQIGRKHSAATLAKVSANNGNNNPDNRAKISAALLGRVFSEEHIAKIKAAASNMSDSHKANISLANRMRPPASGYKGVSLNRQLGKWKVAIRIGDNRPFLGYFTNAEDAARAYDRAAIDAWGVGGCYINMPSDISLAA